MTDRGEGGCCGVAEAQIPFPSSSSPLTNSEPHSATHDTKIEPRLCEGKGEGLGSPHPSQAPFSPYNNSFFYPIFPTLPHSSRPYYTTQSPSHHRMIRTTFLARVSDALHLAASTDDEQVCWWRERGGRGAENLRSVFILPLPPLLVSLFSPRQRWPRPRARPRCCLSALTTIRNLDAPSSLVNLPFSTYSSSREMG